MLADAAHLRQQVVALVGEELAGPAVDLEAIVKAKPVPKKPTQVGTTLNGLLRRGGKVEANGQAAAAPAADPAPAPANDPTPTANLIQPLDTTTDAPSAPEESSAPAAGAAEDAPVAVDVAASVPLPDDGAL